MVLHMENIVWLYTNRNLQKVAVVRVKPYEVVQRNDTVTDGTGTDGIGSDGTEDNSTGTDNVKNDTDDNEEDDAMNKFDLAKDSIGAEYIQMENSVLCLGECCICQGRKA